MHCKKYHETPRQKAQPTDTMSQAYKPLFDRPRHEILSKGFPSKSLASHGASHRIPGRAFSLMLGRTSSFACFESVKAAAHPHASLQQKTLSICSMSPRSIWPERLIITAKGKDGNRNWRENEGTDLLPVQRTSWLPTLSWWCSELPFFAEKGKSTREKTGNHEAFQALAHFPELCSVIFSLLQASLPLKN